MRDLSRFSALAALATAGALALGGCAVGAGTADAGTPAGDASARAVGFPVTVPSCGVDYTYTEAPSRVLLGYPRTLETLDALGVADSASGYALGGYDVLPADYPASVVEVSPDYAPAREAVIAAAPDLVLANDEGQLLGEGTVGYPDLEGIGANVYVLGQYCGDAPAPTSIERVYADVADLGRIFGVESRAAELESELRARVDAAAARNPGDPLEVAFLQVYDGHVYAIGGYPAAGILEALGVQNAFAGLPGNFTELTTEQALVLDADAIVVNYVGVANEAPAIAEVEAMLPAVPAVQAGRVYGSDETDFQAGGVALVANLERLAGQLFGE